MKSGNLLLEMWRILDAKHRRQLPLLILASILTAMSTLGGIASVIPFFTAISDPHALDHHGLLAWGYEYGHFTSVRAFTIFLGVGFVATVFVANAVTYLATMTTMRFAYSVGSALHQRLFHHYLYGSYTFHLQTDSATLTNNVLFEVSRVSIGIMQNLLVMCTHLVTITLIAVSVTALHPLLSVSALTGLGCTYAVIYRMARRQMRSNGLMDSASVARRIKVVNESFTAIKEIITSRTQATFERRFANTCNDIAYTAISSHAIAIGPKHLLECLTIAGLAIATFSLEGDTRGSETWTVQLTFIAFAAYRLLPSLQQLFVAIAKIRSDRPALAAISADLHRSHERCGTAQDDGTACAWRGRPLHGIELNHVCFRYAPSHSSALDDVTLSIPAGAMVGFIGANGSGKSTAADVILGLLAPESGHVAIDGIPLDDANREHWRSTVAYVAQHIQLLDGSVAENIAFGVPTHRIEWPRLYAAARLARVDDFVATRSNDYAERIGERGTRLSGGQRQRIGIARALYRNASLILLDEATSALDGGVEDDVVATLDCLKGQHTIILIAHRLRTLRHCDSLFEFSAGRLVASGAYAQLDHATRRLQHSAALQP